MSTAGTRQHDPRIYQLALSLIPGIGAAYAKVLYDRFPDAASVFEAPRDALCRVEGFRDLAADAVCNYRGFEDAARELERMDRLGIRLVSIWDEDYPTMLRECKDPPPNLFVKGTCDLLHPRMLAVIGTRRCSAYGRDLTARIIAEVAEIRPLILSGLAYGIDACAHRAAIANELPTIAVLAHGLDRVYPATHTGLAGGIVAAGGAVISEYPTGVHPEPWRFPMRNRIVAGMSSGVVVVESYVKGGSLLTAQAAMGYDRYVYAAPGRVEEKSFRGCLNLVDQHSARLYLGARHLFADLGWEKKAPEKTVLNPDEQVVAKLLRSGPLHLDQLIGGSGLDHGQLASAILTMQVNGVILSLPGKVFQMV